MTSMSCSFEGDSLEIGQKVIESIMNQKPRDVGEHLLEIRNFIRSLHYETTSKQQRRKKLEHLGALFEEFALGTPYDVDWSPSEKSNGEHIQHLSSHSGKKLDPSSNTGSMVSGMFSPQAMDLMRNNAKNHWMLTDDNSD